MSKSGHLTPDRTKKLSGVSLSAAAARSNGARSQNKLDKSFVRLALQTDGCCVWCDVELNSDGAQSGEVSVNKDVIV